MILYVNKPVFIFCAAEVLAWKHCQHHLMAKCPNLGHSWVAIWLRGCHLLSLIVPPLANSGPIWVLLASSVYITRRGTIKTYFSLQTACVITENMKILFFSLSLLLPLIITCLLVELGAVWCWDHVQAVRASHWVWDIIITWELMAMLLPFETSSFRRWWPVLLPGDRRAIWCQCGVTHSDNQHHGSCNLMWYFWW